jgi:hypothetical protein
MATQNSGNVSISGGCIQGISISANQLYGANIIQNGDMMVDRQNNGALVTPLDTGAPSRVADRFFMRWTSGGSTLTPPTSQRVATTFGTAAYSPYMLNITAGSSAGASVPGNLQLSLFEMVEGLDTADLQWGTAQAEAATFTLTANGSLAGQHVSVGVTNYAKTRSFAADCLLQNVGAVSQCTGTVPGDTVGTWNNGGGQVGQTWLISLSCGGNLQQTTGPGNPLGQAGVGAWVAGYQPCSSQQTQFTGTAGATFQLGTLKVERGAGGSPGFPTEPSALAGAKLNHWMYMTFTGGVNPANGAGVPGAACGLVFQLPNKSYQMMFQQTFDPAFFSTPKVSIYNPLAGASGWTDMVYGGVLQNSITAAFMDINKRSIMLAATAPVGTLGVAAGDLACAHMVLDAESNYALNF